MGYLAMHMSRMLKMLWQSLRRKLPFAAIFDDRNACLALEIVCQMIVLAGLICLIAVYGMLKAYPVSPVYCIFYWLFIMAHYLSVANAFSRKDLLHMIVDGFLLFAGVVTFFVYFSGESAVQNAFSIIYWMVMVCRYIASIALDIHNINR